VLRRDICSKTLSCKHYVIVSCDEHYSCDASCDKCDDFDKSRVLAAVFVSRSQQLDRYPDLDSHAVLKWVAKSVYHSTSNLLSLCPSQAHDKQVIYVRCSTTLKRRLT